MNDEEVDAELRADSSAPATSAAPVSGTVQPAPADGGAVLDGAALGEAGYTCEEALELASVVGRPVEAVARPS
ncbi:hypothetical protein [Streptomyces sp. TLI_053]|uniref:hypothetical protein n=1 Tax=Streptomyces sp. TLI_053 TaxID=1855352 RepID=UPI00135210D9|nr:hypothetical protein [Streptomyces sp. TLI_053]